MSPPPPPSRGRRRPDDNELESILRRTRRRRAGGKAKRKRRTTLILAALLIVVLALIASGVGRGGRVPLELQPRHAPPRRDRPELVRLRGERGVAWLDPRRAKPHPGRALARQPVDAQGHRGDRGPSLLQPRRGRLRGDRPCRLEGHQRRRGRPGRLDDHAAARPQPLHLEGADVQAEGQGGLPRDQAEPSLVEGPDPQRVHEPGLLRQPRLRDRGGGADLLLQACSEPDPRPVGATRRPAAGAVVVRPAAPSRRRARAP